MYAPLRCEKPWQRGSVTRLHGRQGSTVARARPRLVDAAQVRCSYWRHKDAADRLDWKVQQARPHGSMEGDFSRAFLLNGVLWPTSCGATADVDTRYICGYTHRLRCVRPSVYTPHNNLSAAVFGHRSIFYCNSSPSRKRATPREV